MVARQPDASCLELWPSAPKHQLGIRMHRKTSVNFQVCCTGTEKGLWVLILWRHFAFGKVNRPYVWRDDWLLQGFERAQIYFVDYFYNEDRVNKHITKNPMYCKSAPNESVTLWRTASIAWHDVLMDKLPENNPVFQNTLTFHHYFLLLCNTFFFLGLLFFFLFQFVSGEIELGEEDF